MNSSRRRVRLFRYFGYFLHILLDFPARRGVHSFHLSWFSFPHRPGAATRAVRTRRMTRHARCFPFPLIEKNSRVHPAYKGSHGGEGVRSPVLLTEWLAMVRTKVLASRQRRFSRSSLTVRVEPLETRLPVSEGIGPFLAVSALSAAGEHFGTSALAPPPPSCASCQNAGQSPISHQSRRVARARAESSPAGRSPRAPRRSGDRAAGRNVYHRRTPFL